MLGSRRWVTGNIFSSSLWYSVPVFFCFLRCGRGRGGASGSVMWLLKCTDPEMMLKLTRITIQIRDGCFLFLVYFFLQMLYPSKVRIKNILPYFKILYSVVDSAGFLYLLIRSPSAMLAKIIFCYNVYFIQKTLKFLFLVLLFQSLRKASTDTIFIVGGGAEPELGY